MVGGFGTMEEGHFYFWRKVYFRNFYCLRKKQLQFKNLVIIVFVIRIKKYGKFAARKPEDIIFAADTGKSSGKKNEHFI